MRNGGCIYGKPDRGNRRPSAERCGAHPCGEKQRASAACGVHAVLGEGAAAGSAPPFGCGGEPCTAAGSGVRGPVGRGGCCPLRPAENRCTSGTNGGTNAGVHPVLCAAAGEAGPRRDEPARRVQDRGPAHRSASGRAAADGGCGVGRRAGPVGADGPLRPPRAPPCCGVRRGSRRSQIWRNS